MARSAPAPERTALQVNLERLMLAKKFNMKSLAAAAGIGETAVRDIIVGRSKRPAHHTLKAIADELDCPVDELTGPDFGSASATPRLGPAAGRSSVKSPWLDDPENLPVFGRAQGGTGIPMIPVEQDPVDRVPRPPQLRGVREGFALFTHDDSMSPRYEHGETLLIHPHLPTKPGDGVVIIKMTDEVIVKRLVRKTDVELTLLEYQPKRREFTLPRSQVRAIYRIMGTYDVR